MPPSIFDNADTRAIVNLYLRKNGLSLQDALSQLQNLLGHLYDDVVWKVFFADVDFEPLVRGARMTVNNGFKAHVLGNVEYAGRQAEQKRWKYHDYVLGRY